jgi:hypothetical protein
MMYAFAFISASSLFDDKTQMSALALPTTPCSLDPLVGTTS